MAGYEVNTIENVLDRADIFVTNWNKDVIRMDHRNK